MFVPAFCTHVCLGAPYGWSAISAQLTREAGLVTSAAGDWSLDLATYPMSVMIACGGVSAALLGSVAGKIGIRKAMVIGGLLYGSGFGLSAAGVATHNLAMLYAGNFICGVGYGLTYTPPIQALIDWFPDRKGLASGLVIAGFGSGALFFTPMMGMLSGKFAQMPQYLGAAPEVVLEGGRQFSMVGGQLQEVVYATASELAKLPYEGLAEGFYLAGSGNTGVAGALACIGGVYAATIISSALTIRRPAAGYQPEGWSPAPGTAVATGNVDVATVMKVGRLSVWFNFSNFSRRRHSSGTCSPRAPSSPPAAWGSSRWPSR
jgi:MFS family permease